MHVSVICVIVLLSGQAVLQRLEAKTCACAARIPGRQMRFVETSRYTVALIKKQVQV